MIGGVGLYYCYSKSQVKKNPQHSYQEIGEYNVSLQIVDIDGDISIFQIPVSIINHNKKNSVRYIIIPIIGGIITISVRKKRKKTTTIPLYKLSV